MSPTLRRRARDAGSTHSLAHPSVRPGLTIDSAAIRVALAELFIHELPVVGVPAGGARPGARLELARDFRSVEEIDEDESIQHDLQPPQLMSQLGRAGVEGRDEPLLGPSQDRVDEPRVPFPGLPGVVTALAISIRSAKYSRRQSPTHAVIETPRAAASCCSCR
jgi:hypothetical protein